MRVCVNCNMELRGNEDCPRCAATRAPAPTGNDPALTYLRNFFQYCSADPTCPDCDARYEGTQSGPFDAGHWTVSHWRREHPDLYAQHKAQLEGSATT